MALRSLIRRTSHIQSSTIIGMSKAPKTTQSHYEAHSASSYESAFFYSPGEYMDYLCNTVQERLGFFAQSQPRRLLDIGGGTGNFTRLLVKEFPEVYAIVVDPFLEFSSNGKDGQQVMFVKAGAETFAKRSNDWWRTNYHQVLMKEVIHHLEASDRVPLFRGIREELSDINEDAPSLLIITRPQNDHDYPLWSEARQVWAQNQPSLDDIRTDLLTAGFERVEYTMEAYPCSTQLSRWLGMIRCRFWSTFSNFTDAELEEACQRIANDELARVDDNGDIHFEDRLLFISAFKK